MMRFHGVPPKKPIFEPIGVRLKVVRKHHKMTQSDVAEILKISRSAYQYYERCEREATVSVAVAFIEHFQLDSEWLLFGEFGRSKMFKKGAD